MSDQTKGGIAWTYETWNPICGCSMVSTGCANCYAEKVAVRFGGKGGPYEGTVTNGRWNGTIKLVEEHLTDPLRWKRPRRVFVNSMSDLFHPNCPDEWVDRIFAVMAMSPQHTFQILTKRPERMAEYLFDRETWIAQEVERRKWKATVDFDASDLHLPEWPLPNVWLGTSVENQATADDRIPHLLNCLAAVRFLSVEPLLGPVDLTRLGFAWGEPNPRSNISRIDWVIAGGESGAVARPCNVEWVRSIVAQCKAAGVPCFVKQLGSNVYSDTETWWKAEDVGAKCKSAAGGVSWKLNDSKGGDQSEWPKDLRVREWPEAKS